LAPVPLDGALVPFQIVLPLVPFVPLLPALPVDPVDPVAPVGPISDVQLPGHAPAAFGPYRQFVVVSR
jgi:hypothetical protein